MSKVAQMESLSHNAVVLDSFLGFALQAMVVETAIVASKSVAWLLMMVHFSFLLLLINLPFYLWVSGFEWSLQVYGFLIFLEFVGKI